MAGMMGPWQGNNTQPTGPNNSMVSFINSDADAVTYPVNPGMTVALLNVNDPNNGRLFLKSAEMNGCPNPMRVFKIQDITPQKQDPNSVSRQEFDKLNTDMQEIKNMLASLTAPKATGGK